MDQIRNQCNIKTTWNQNCNYPNLEIIGTKTELIHINNYTGQNGKYKTIRTKIIFIINLKL